MADSKNLNFQNRQFSKFFHENFSDGSLGLVGLNDVKGIDVAQRYGCEAVRQKLKNSQKVPKMHFLTVFELLSDSLTAIYVELHQCPSHHLILLTQGRI